MTKGDEGLGRVCPAPNVTVESRPYWDAAQERKLLIKWCDDCKRHHWLPRPICPFCFSNRTSWQESQGRGRIYSFSIMRKSATGPYALAYVELDEGPIILSNLVGMAIDDMAIGKKVSVTFSQASGPEGALVPVFTATEEGG